MLPLCIRWVENGMKVENKPGALFSCHNHPSFSLINLPHIRQNEDVCLVRGPGGAAFMTGKKGPVPFSNYYSLKGVQGME